MWRLPHDCAGPRWRGPAAGYAARDRTRSRAVSGEKVASEVEVNSYKVVYERDESGSWIARGPRGPGCHTYGRTIDQTRGRVREALDLWVRDAAHASFGDEVRLPTRLRASVSRAHPAGKRADAGQAHAPEA